MNGAGACYLLCWAATPYPGGKRPAHYLGYTNPEYGAEAGVLVMLRGVMGADELTPAMAAGVLARDVEHQEGRGARLTAAVAAAGITWRHARVWAGTTKDHETWLKDLNDRRVLCAICNPGTRAGLTENIRPKRYRRGNARAGLARIA